MIGTKKSHPSTFTLDAPSEELSNFFNEFGYLIFPEFLKAEHLEAINKELDEHFKPFWEHALEEARGSNSRKTFECDVIPWHPLDDDNQIFIDLLQNAELNKITREVLGDGFIAKACLVMYAVGGGKGQAWHQDCPDEVKDAFNLNRLIYTQDVRHEDGALVFVPGSHKMGRIPPGEAQAPIGGEVALCPKAGTLALLHGHVYHRVTHNLNQKPRTSVNYRAYPKGIDPSVNCIGVYRNGSVNFCDTPKYHDGTPVMDGKL
ncbi:phytanoyl-CoA dioxygenase family protein [Ruficoccus sp. ZRK36]|uniref:phytanoyl-CoA dioxygenase family protein n=1 Tax=Ruficoccus sp. ZRK36 TaxID=2866311 RepID=UPI001C739E6D|nr:phytanoyl-CoA dioxygenase family protein [Ruficoccus sp. ZRK36]QYY35276.1 phytanoyl-CoA dioxygenase family protein [Ruficoccus sp. ZRK36]